MTKNISTRAVKKAFNRPLSADLSLVVFSGLIVWGIGAVVCHFIGLPSTFALGVAVLWTAWGFFDTFKQRRLDYLGHLVDELADDLKQQLAQISGQLVELQASVSRLEGHSRMADAEFPHGYAASEPNPPRMDPNDPGGIYVPWVATDDDMAGAVQLAMSETNATSQKQMGMVIKAARDRLRGKRFNEEELRNLVRTRLEGKL